jgi:hypothetical protein
VSFIREEDPPAEVFRGLFLLTVVVALLGLASTWGGC